jgi:hypothetical protein
MGRKSADHEMGKLHKKVEALIEVILKGNTNLLLMFFYLGFILVGFVLRTLIALLCYGFGC